MTPPWTKLLKSATDKFWLDDENVILDQICKNTRIDRTGCHGNGKRWIGTSSLAQGNTTLFRLPVSFYTRELFLSNIHDSIWFWRQNWRLFERVNFLLSGIGIFQIGDQIVEVDANKDPTLIIIPGNTPHQILNEKDEPLMFFYYFPG